MYTHTFLFQTASRIEKICEYCVNEAEYSKNIVSILASIDFKCGCKNNFVDSLCTVHISNHRKWQQTVRCHHCNCTIYWYTRHDHLLLAKLLVIAFRVYMPCSCPVNACKSKKQQNKKAIECFICHTHHNHSIIWYKWHAKHG